MVRLVRKRYIGFRIMSEIPYEGHEALNLMLKELQSIRRNHVKETRIRLLEYREEECLGILLCDNESVDHVLRLLQSLNERNREVIFRSLGVSGTIKALRSKFLDKASRANRAIRKSF